MNLTTSSYSTMLGGLWGPEGSEINERLKKLEQLQQMRKQREAKLRSELQNADTGVSIVRTQRIKSSDIDSEQSSGPRFRRAISMRDEETDRYGGARPKMGSFSTYGQEDSGNSGKSLFSDITSSVLGTRKPLRDYSTRSRLDSDDSDSGPTSSYRFEFTRPNVTETAYKNIFSKPEDKGDRNLFSGISVKARNRPGYESTTYSSRRMNTEVPRVNNEHNSYDDDDDDDVNDEYSNDQISTEFENKDDRNNEGHEDEEEDHDEEPKYFIERLKNGNGNYQIETNNTNGHSIPEVPPYNGDDTETETFEVYYEDIPNLVQPEEDILYVAQEISTTFGNLKSPIYRTPKQSSDYKSYPRKKFSEEVVDANNGVEDPDVSVTYVLQEAEYDSEGDEEGKTLPVRESMYIASTTEWNALDQTQGKLDEMHEFFTGEAPNEDPNISRELDGDKVKAELEKSFSTPKTNGHKTPTSVKKSTKKGSTVKRSKSPLDKLKSSESENDSIATSESETDVQKKKPSTPRKNGTPSSAKKTEKHGMSLTDKLAKLESLTQEKKRKHSFSENEAKKNVPSYMSSTSASQKKRVKERESSPRNLKKDVRELKQFVHEHASEPNTPVTSPTKHVTEELLYKEKKTTREMSVQTEYVIDFPDIKYVCKHCGKSSQEEVQSSLTKENVSKAFGQKTKRDSPDSEKAKTVEIKISSKDSVKSLGETSTKSEKIYRYKPKATGGTQGYMKGTTSSRLRNNANNVSNSDGKARKGSAPEIAHLAAQESSKVISSLKGNVSQKAKAIENSTRREKNKPTLSLFRGSSAERSKLDTANKKSQLAKSKSVDQVNVLRQELLKPDNNTKDEKEDTKSKESEKETSPVNNAQQTQVSSPTKKKAPTPPKVAPKPVAVEKLDLSSLGSPRSPIISPRSPSTLTKPPVASPRLKDTECSPRSASSVVTDDGKASVVSKGLFTTLDDNPFIKNDSGRRNSLKGHDRNESVWEKAESRSRDSSLKRSNSTTDRERQSSASSLKRHNTSAGEKSSVSELTWSDSGSTGSLRGSKSSLHGSNSSLNKDSSSAFYRPRSVSQSSITSQTSQNAMLNLLSPIGTTRHPVTGAMETDVDAAYNDHSKDLPKSVEHDEETVNRAHLEFAKKACDLLEFEMKKRDSSNESDKGKNKIEENKENNNNIKNLNNEDTSSIQNVAAPTKKEKPKKGLRKLFKK